MKILVIPGLTLPTVDEETLEKIRIASQGAEVVVAGGESALDEVVDAEVVLGFVNREMFLRAQKLKWVQSISSGVDMFFFDEFVESDVVLTSEKGLVGSHLADHAFGLLLMLTRQLRTSLEFGPDTWSHRGKMRRQMFELTGLTLGVFGYGSTGRHMVQRGAGFGMELLALDREILEPTAPLKEVWPLDRFEELQARSDVLAICCPLTKETKELFDSRVFQRMKDSSILVNVTRGEVMVESNLIDALDSGEISGAALDVTPREPLPSDSPLWSMGNVVMTPHTAGASQFRSQRNLERFLRNLQNYLSKEPLEGRINMELGY